VTLGEWLPIPAPHRAGSRQTSRLALVAFIMVAAVALSACTTSAPPMTSNDHRPTRATATSTGWVRPGPAGMQASWVLAENQKPGSTDWRIRGTAGPAIAGYADTTAATVGATIRLYVSTTSRFHVEAYRMGYYGGDQARLVWRSRALTGRAQPPCPLTPAVNMISCRWAASLSVSITPAWVQGDYLLKLIADPGRQSYLPLTIWDPSSHATYLVDNSVFTWQAWNPYGGYDMYGGAPPGQTRQFAARARVMSYDRPYGYGDGAADFLGNELPLVSLVEQHGLDVTYLTDITFTEHPSLILRHRVYLSLGHAECWSNPQRAAAVSGIAHGVNFVFFAASPILRHVRAAPGQDGAPDREMVDYRDERADPILASNPQQATGNTWAAPPASAPPSEITADTYGGYGLDDPLVVTDASAWPFAGTGLRDGSQLAHLVRFDFDFYDTAEPGPSNVQILAHSPVQPQQAIVGATHSDMTYYTAPSGAAVIATGTNGWIGALTACPAGTSACPASLVQTITANILRVFGPGPAGRAHPAIPNWRQFY
jgi:hypothetical protein